MCHLQELHEAYREKGLLVLGVNCSDDEAIALEFLDDNGARFPNVIDESAATRKTCNDEYQTMDIFAVPMSVIIDRKGKVAAAWYGQHDEAGIRRVLARLGLR